MADDSIIFEYPFDKFGNNEPTEEHENINNRNAVLEYVLRSEGEELPQVFLKRVEVPNQEGVDTESLAETDMLADEVLSFDTCFRLSQALQRSEFQITSAVNQIGANHATISKYLESAEATICSINYFQEKRYDDIRKENNSIVEEFITEHARGWEYRRTQDITVYPRLMSMELEEDKRQELITLLRRLDEYPETLNGARRQAPYYIYQKMAALVDDDFYDKRFLLKTLHYVETEGARNRNRYYRQFACLVLDTEDYRGYITRAKNNYILYVQNAVSSYLAADSLEEAQAFVDVMGEYIEREANTNYHRRYNWSGFNNGGSPDGRGCVGILLSPSDNRFAFSGYKDVDDSKLRAQIPGSGDKLSGLIKAIEKSLSIYSFKPERTNREERFYDAMATVFYDLNGDLPLNDLTKNRYQCCEKKLLSHVYQSFNPGDDVVIITTFPTCDKPNRKCQDLVKEYRKLCNSIRAFYISDYDTGKVAECIF